MSRLWTLVAAGLAGFAVGLPTPPSSEVADSNQCFAETFMLSNTMLGMYCGNHNTANYAYNWTSYDGPLSPLTAPPHADAPALANQRPSHRLSPGSTSICALATTAASL